MRTKEPRQRGRRAKVTSSPETIFYVDENGNGSPGDADKSTLGSGESKDFVLQYIMSCVSQEGYQLIINSFGHNGISACNSVTGNTRWEVRGETSRDAEMDDCSWDGNRWTGASVCL